MVKLLKDLHRGWKIFISVCVLLPTIAGGIQGYKAIKSEIKTAVIEHAQPYIQKEVKRELEIQKKNKETSYRFKRSTAFGVPVDSLLVVDKAIYLNYLKTRYLLTQMDSINKDKIALTNYLKSLSLYIWKELTSYPYKGVMLGYSENTGLIFHMYEGFVFEAYHKGSTDSYWFKDSYGIERECK